jgi:hypothetical protein
MLLRDSDVRRKYELAAVQLASQFDWSRIVQQFAEVLNAAMITGGVERQTAGNTVSVSP